MFWELKQSDRYRGGVFFRFSWNVVANTFYYWNSQLCEDWQVDYELYNWEKLDPNAESTKQMVTDYFSWTGTDKGGRKFKEGRIFK